VSRYNPARDAGPAFVDRVADWIATDGEVLVVIRWVAGGGHRDFALCRSRADFERLIEIACDGTELIAIRGPVTEHLIAHVLESVPEESDYLVMSVATKPDSPMAARVSEGDTHADLEDTLRAWMGIEIAAGICPNFWVADHEGMISRAKGGVEGPR
jgi:hypothetical protein